MRIIGLNLTLTSEGIHLDDGACALLEDDHFTAGIPEERLSRRKYSGGVRHALHYCLSSRGLKLEDIDVFAVSICCDTVPSRKIAQKLLEAQGVCLPTDKIEVCPSHHLSHAASAYFSSPYEEAIILVADNEGSILGDRLYPNYSDNSLERTTLYTGTKNKIELLRRFNQGPGELSLGATYGYFTRWIGHHDYHAAGKVMALAAYGDGDLRGACLHRFEDGNLKCFFRPLKVSRQYRSQSASSHGSPANICERNDLDRAEFTNFVFSEAVREFFFSAIGVDIGERRTSCEHPDHMQREVAWLVQKETEKALVNLVLWAIDETGIRNVCLAGGVGLNCVANQRIATLPKVSGLYIQPAASDWGQAIGNALWYYHSQNGGRRIPQITDCFLGRVYSEEDICQCLEKEKSRVYFCKCDDVSKVAATEVAAGRIIGWFMEGAEFGPRALGHRSIIGDPRTERTKERLDSEIKLREGYRPYAPSVMQEYAREWFDISEDLLRKAFYPMQFMLLAPRVKAEKAVMVPAITCVDGSSRVHIVKRDADGLFHSLIAEFNRITGVPLVLNTSFNVAGAPIVESVGDALEAFHSMHLDLLVIGPYVVRRR
jgi:carbamoyltransferase